MTLVQLTYFCSLVRNGTYSRAAEECDVSEPAIHRSIRSLEKACGMELVGKNGKRLRLTPAGRDVYESGLQINSIIDQTRQSLIEKERAIRGSISIGGGTTVLLHLLPQVLATWMSENPHISVSIMEGRVGIMQDRLLDDRLDLVFASDANWSKELHKQQIFTDSLVVVSAPGHFLTKHGLIPLSQVSKERIIVASTGTSTHDEIERIETRYNVQFTSKVEVERHYTARMLCMAGVGLAIVPRSLVNDDLRNKRLSLLNAEGFPSSRPYFVIYRRDKILTREMQSLLGAVGSWVQKRRTLGAALDHQQA